MLVNLHIIAGGVALLTGSISFLTKKGGRIHRQSGKAFVISMAVMAALGALLAYVNDERLNVVAGLFTLYLVCTAYIAGNSKELRPDVINLLLTSFAIVVGAYAVLTGFNTLNQGIVEIDGQPAQVIIVFGSLALVAGFADIYQLKKQKITYNVRLSRHSLRIGFAMFLACASFFLGQAQVFPDTIRGTGILAAPVLLVFFATVFWAIRVRFWGLARRK